MRRPARAVVLVVAYLAASAAAQEGGDRVLSRIVEVVLADGEAPVAGVVVEAWGAPGGTVRRETGADGTVRFERMPRTGVVFVARKAGCRCGWHQPGAWSWAPDPEDDDPDGDGVTRLRLVLEAGSALRGRVISKDGGAPLAGARVEAREAAHATDVSILEGAPLWTATTDADGRFETTEHWPPAPEAGDLVSAVIVARAEGRISAAKEVWPGDAAPRAPLIFELATAATIRGVVTRPGGEPSAHASVFASPVESGGDGGDLRSECDGEGRYSFPEAEPGLTYQVYAEEGAPVVARSRVATAVVDGALASCDLRLLRVGSICVRVATAADSLQVEFVPPEGTRAWVDEREREDGSIVVEEADAGRWTVVIRAFGWLDRRVAVELAEGERKSVEILLERGACAEGVLLDDLGRPVANATLYAYTVDPADPEAWLDGYEQATSDVKGRFRLQGLPAGATDITVGECEGLLSEAPTRVSAPVGNVRIVLHRPGGIRFRLRTPGGEAAPERVRATLTRLAGATQGSQWQEMVDADEGGFEILDQLPGLVALAVEARGYAPFVARVEIPAGGVQEPAPFALARGIALRGRVVDGSGNPVAGAAVMAWGNEETVVATGADGGFELPHLAPGGAEISVTADGMAQALLTTSVAADARPLHIVVTPGGLVRGTIRASDDGWASLDFFPADAPDDNVTRWRAEVTDGAFAIRLPPGRYRCTLPRPDGARGPTLFDVREGAEIVYGAR